MISHIFDVTVKVRVLVENNSSSSAMASKEAIAKVADALDKGGAPDVLRIDADWVATR